jgi:hypothetical protein
VVQEFGWDEDVDDDLRVQVEDTVDGDLVDGDYGNVVDALVDALTDLADGGSIWLLTPKVGRPGSVDAADVTEAAPVAGLAVTTTLPICPDWTATRLAAPKNHPR